MSFEIEEVMLSPCSTVNQAARAGNLNEIKRLVRDGHPVDAADNRGWRALHEATKGGYIEAIQFLLERGSDVNWGSFEGITSLNMACEEGNAQAVSLLLEHAADPNLHDHVNTYPILSAVKSGNADCVRQLLTHGASINAQLYCGTSALHQAAGEGMVDMVALLLENEADISIQEDYGITPIFTASQYGQTECLKLLLEKANESGDSSLVNSPADDGATPLYLASQEGHTDCVRVLLQHGASANMSTEQPKALPLHAALQFNHAECVELLLPHTDKEAIQSSDLSPFYFSLVPKETQLTKALIKAGISPSQRHTDIDGWRPSILHYFYPRIQYSKRLSPLVLCAMYGYPLNQAAVLIDFGASVNAQTTYEVPPLLPALLRKNYAFVRLLIQRGASLNIYHPKIISNMTLLVTCMTGLWAGLNLLLLCGAEAESLFSSKACHAPLSLPPAEQRVSDQEDGMSDVDEEGYDNELGVLRYPVPYWRMIAEARVPSNQVTMAQILHRLLLFVGNVCLDPHFQSYVDSREEWRELCNVVDSPRDLSHLCRLMIRRQMSHVSLSNEAPIRSLPLPETVKDFLLYKELVPD